MESYNKVLENTKKCLANINRNVNINGNVKFSPLYYILNFDILFCLKNKDPNIRAESLKLYIDSMTKFYLQPAPKKILHSILKNYNYYGFNFSIIDKTDTIMCIKKNVLYHHLESTGVFLFLIIGTYGQ